MRFLPTNSLKDVAKLDELVTLKSLVSFHLLTPRVSGYVCCRHSESCFCALSPAALRSLGEMRLFFSFAALCRSLKSGISEYRAIKTRQVKYTRESIKVKACRPSV